MKLTYCRTLFEQANAVHRFDVLGDVNSNDLEVIEKSLTRFLLDLEPSDAHFNAMIIDFSDCTLKAPEPVLQECTENLKGLALSSKVFLTVSQTDIESLHAQNKIIETALNHRIQELETRLLMMESVKNQIRVLEYDNKNIREQLNSRSIGNRSTGIFDKLWGES